MEPLTSVLLLLPILTTLNKVTIMSDIAHDN